ncbi:heme NO-binding domain-containing protein [Sphingopyxis sp. BSNA05]|uniref:heme NO-binding domain-containing protein n=1 Tax=Sphingopyxis sp. BSNA05 TaxID=1236614 RepID=UPI001564013A|nr:heme NO-binding domain-containing protein [Sphingopyxis sp. BSNA05]
MKGIIFTELVRFMEKVQSPEFADQVISGAALPNDGAFTSIGNYPSEYALAMVGQASEQSGIEATELCRLFGKYLYDRFNILYPHIMESYNSAESLLTHVGSHIHTEVCVLYPDARPPQVTADVQDGQTVIHYHSHRPMAAIAHGLVQGCMDHYGDQRSLEWECAVDGKSAIFTIKG